jgi:hypothetical protein
MAVEWTTENTTSNSFSVLACGFVTMRTCLFEIYLVSDLHTTIFNCVCILLHAPLLVMGWIAYLYLTIHTTTICLLTLHFDVTCFAHNVINIMFAYEIM